jgi:hypothetical protein
MVMRIWELMGDKDRREKGERRKEKGKGAG